MESQMTVAITTHVIGWGGERRTEPTHIHIPQTTISARTLIHEHIRTELHHMQHQHMPSLALHYLSNNPYMPPECSAPLDVATHIQSTYEAINAGHCLLMINGVPVNNLDAELSLNARSRIGIVRLFSA